LEGQRAAVLQHIHDGVALLAEYTEVETGKRDVLTNRPELRKALAHAKRSKAVLVVAKLDRLTAVGCGHLDTPPGPR
jgi:DNA invertase Pin-like site-specific DNA recombinase